MTRVGIIGVSGYTGMELVRIILGHPGAELSYATSRSWAGRTLDQAMPHLGGASRLEVTGFGPDAALERADFFFLCLPHGESMETAALLVEAGAKVVDLSADFRLSDPELYMAWYGEHTRRDLIPRAVYGLPELYRERIAGASLVANPGCYPTSVILGLAPLLEGGLADPHTLLVDSKSGVSGAGREPRPAYHFPEMAGDFSAYNIGGRHRHTGEMEQELSLLAGEAVRITFSPHLLPVSRGILSTIYARPSSALDEETLCAVYRRRYGPEPFVRVAAPDEPLPSLKDVRGTNLCRIAPRMDPRTGTIVIVSVIDNLVKGASGQAVQNMNLMAAQDEETGLKQTALHP